MWQTNAINGVLIDDAALTVEELARACAVEPDWVVKRVETGVLLDEAPGLAQTWRFTSLDLRRARRLRELERVFDANPEIAALVVDLSEEVRRLRTRLGAVGAE